MQTLYSVEQLADLVHAWCEEHGVTPASGQTGERMTERNVRYYRTLALLDPPLAGGGQGYGEKHRLQLETVFFSRKAAKDAKKKINKTLQILTHFLLDFHISRRSNRFVKHELRQLPMP